jgi:hypothetical protein
LGNILGEFFTNSSGHPASYLPTYVGEWVARKWFTAIDHHTGLPDFSLYDIPKWGKMYQITTKSPNAHT